VARAVERVDEVDRSPREDAFSSNVAFANAMTPCPLNRGGQTVSRPAASCKSREVHLRFKTGHGVKRPSRHCGPQ
jgi:hypothetical protein